MGYRLIIFDLGGVVVECETDRVIHQVSYLAGRPLDEVHQAVYLDELLLPFELGRISAHAYYQGLKDRLNIPWTYEQFVRSWNDMIREKPEITALLPKLSRQCRLIVLSNTNELHLNHIRASYPAMAAFEEWIASCNVGLRKPDPEIYHLALRRCGVAAQKAIYIDDRPELSEAGRALGLASIRFENKAQFERELRALGLEL